MITTNTLVEFTTLRFAAILEVNRDFGISLEDLVEQVKNMPELCVTHPDCTSLSYEQIVNLILCKLGYHFPAVA